jgi:hypothetical protein
MRKPVDAPPRFLDPSVDRFFFRFRRLYQFRYPYSDRHANSEGEKRDDH